MFQAWKFDLWYCYIANCYNSWPFCTHALRMFQTDVNVFQGTDCFLSSLKSFYWCFLSQLFQCYALRPQQPSWGIPRAQCFVLPSGPYGWGSVWCPQPCLLPWPTTWICGRPTRPWLAMPWTRSPWISCCPPASTSRWTSRERPRSSTSSWWVLLCTIKTASPTHRHYLMAVLTGWLLWSGGNIFFGSTSRFGPTNHDDVVTLVAKVVQKSRFLLKKIYSHLNFTMRMLCRPTWLLNVLLLDVLSKQKHLITVCRGSIYRALMTPSN